MDGNVAIPSLHPSNAALNVAVLLGSSPSVSADDNRAVCMVDDVVADAAQDGAPDAAHAPRPHHYLGGLHITSQLAQVLTRVAKLRLHLMLHLHRTQQIFHSLRVCILRFHFSCISLACQVLNSARLFILKCSFKGVLHLKPKTHI